MASKDRMTPPSPREKLSGSPKELNPPSPRLPRVPPPSPNIGRERFGSQGSQGSQDSGGKIGSVQQPSNQLHHSKPAVKVI